MPKKTPDTATFTNAADQAVLDDIEQRRQRGEDVFGDLDDEPAQPATATAAADTPAVDDDPATDAPAADAVATGEDTPAAEPAAAADQPAATTDEPAAEPAADEPQAATPQYQTLTKAQIDEKIADLGKREAALFTEFDEGTITRDDYLVKLADLRKEDRALTSQATLLEANEQARLAAEGRKIEGIKAQAKKDGTIDYDADEAAVEEFNAALSFAFSVKSNAGKSFDEIADKAHAMVLAQRGITAPKANEPAAPAAPAQPTTMRTAPKPPITLGQVPAAATANTGGGLSEQLGRLDGLDFQDAVGNLPKAQRDAWLDS